MRNAVRLPLLLFVLGLSLGNIGLGGTRLLGQDAVAAPVSGAVVPHVVQYGGTFSSSSLEPVTVRFALYSSQTGGEPVWSETQRVTLDAKGRYSVLLGAATAAGLPQSVFSSGEAKWLGVSLNNESELPRTALVATPYSLKASDAETIGGHPASDFKLVPKDSEGRPEAATDITQINVSQGILGGGTGPTVALQLDPVYFQELAANFALKNGGNTFTGNQTITGNLSVSGSLTGPSVLSLSNANIFKAAQTLGPLSTSTATTGYASNALKFAASGYNSTASVAEAINFAWQAEPVGNDSASPSGTMNLLYSTGTNAPAETGFKFASNGVLTFASGQTFPGLVALSANNAFTGTNSFSKTITFASGQTFPGAGTITGITTTSPLAGGGTSGSVALSLNTTALETTLSTKYAQLAAGNNFTGVNAFTTTDAGSYILNATNQATSGFGILGTASNVGVSGSSTGTTAGVQGYGVYGITANPAGSAGVYGFAPSNESTGNNSAGVEGVTGALSTTGNFVTTSYPFGSGVWGDTGTDTNYGGYGVLGTADDAYGGLFANKSATYDFPSLLAINYGTDSATGVFEAFNYDSSTTCIIDYGADLSCDGTLSGSNVTADKHALKTYAVQSAENWTEDAGGGQLSGGHAHIDLEEQFAKVVNTGADYHVFLTPEGDCKGLYIAGKTATGFDVRELGGGKASVPFGYRIMAKRRGFETERLKDVTEARNRNLQRMSGTANRIKQGPPPQTTVRASR